MNTADEKWTNEMMEIEDQVEEEMREEFRKRLERRLQERLEAKERDMPQVRDLKKNAQSRCT